MMPRTLVPSAIQRKQVSEVDSLAGKYRLIAELGQGGMATVFLAVMVGNSGFRKLAVVKVLRPEMAEDGDFVQMFLDEAKLCARLSHPNIVHTYDVGVDVYGHLMAMEYLDGVSLHAAVGRMLKTGSPLQFPAYGRVLLDVLAALEYAHALNDYDGRPLGIVHRDVTPQNIFVTYDGQVKLLDFGIAKAATSSFHTATGVIKGKLRYMAPEQARGEAVDRRADLYAVGVMLWESITGRRRWPSGLTEPAIYARIALGEPPESAGSAGRGYPAELDAVVMKSLANQPGDRYQTAGEFQHALSQIMRDVELVSLRDVGARLAGIFADGRERLRTVIEEQFRLIDAGGPPSEPRLVPAVASPSMITGSQSYELPAKGHSGSDMPAGEGPMGKTAPSRGLSRALGAVLAVGAVTVALALMKVKASPDGAPPVAPLGASPDPRPTSNIDAPLPAVGDLRAPSPPPEAVRAMATEASPRPLPAKRVEARPRAPAPTRAATSAAPAEPSTAALNGAAANGNDPASNSAPHLRIDPPKPKVQLERDNPWP